jgi:hypothetical protein
MVSYGNDIGGDFPDPVRAENVVLLRTGKSDSCFLVQIKRLAGAIGFLLAPPKNPSEFRMK